MAPLLLLLAACGGGGGGAPAPVLPTTVVLGLAASTVPTTYARTFTNPFGAQATVDLVETLGPFGVAAGALPTSVTAAGDVVVPVVFTPPGPGVYDGGLTLEFVSGASRRRSSEAYRVSAEAVSVLASPAALDFGDVAPGSSATRVLRLTNGASLSPVTLRTFAGPTAEVTLASPPLPLTVPAAGFLDVTLRVQPADAEPLVGAARLGADDPGGPVDVQILANTAPTEVVVDFGLVPFSPGSSTATLQFNLAGDAVAFMIEAVAGPNDVLGLASLTGPGGKVYENTSSTGAYVWNPNPEVFTAQVPNTDRSDVQLVPGGGTYSFALRRLAGSSSSATVRVLVERRAGATNPAGTLDLNVWLAAALSVDAASAPTDTRLQSVLSGIGSILAGQGVTLGDIDYYDVASATYDRVSEAEFPGLLALTSSASQTRLNLFFVQEAIGGGVVGVAGMIGGPKRNGTGSSGVMSVFEGFSVSLISQVAAHELGHYLGLWHTVESTGQHDFIDDTLNCPAEGTGNGCATSGGGYLMHWLALGGTTLTAGQGLVIRGHPLLSPGAVVAGKPARAVALPSADPTELLSLGSGWCGTCKDCGAQRKR